MEKSEMLQRKNEEMSKKNKAEVKAMIIVAAVIFAFILMGFLIPPYFEMRTFNKFTTGPKATYWDAVFAELRVEAVRQQ